MSLDKAIEHHHEHRKQYYGGKAVDPRCRNHGDCEWCRNNRQFQSLKADEATRREERDYRKGKLDIEINNED